MFKRKTKTNHIIPNPFRIMFHILAAPSPDPITVPEPYQVVDWVNMRFKPTLPNPVDCPVLSISKDPEVYHKQKGLYNLIDPSKFSSGEPFGTFPGYRKTQGVPANPVQGYIFCPTLRKWIIHASHNPGGRRPAGRGYQGTSRGERERGKMPHSLPALSLAAC